jgi:hypothetical protein
MHNDLAFGHVWKYYAACSDGNVFTAFAVMDRTSASLAPLTRFGFTINPLP